MPDLKRSPLSYSGIFFDSASLEQFKLWFRSGILGGATTNPVLLQKEKVLDVSSHIQKMVKIAGEDFPISIEIPDTKMSIEDMVNLAKKYQKKFPKNAIVKIPMDPMEPQKAYEVIYKLCKEGIRFNATLGLSMGQLIAAAEAGRESKAKGDNYISLFWGRRDEAKKQIIDELKKTKVKINLGQKWEDLISDASQTLKATIKYLEDHGLTTRVIVGSIRHSYQIEQAFLLGADIVTIPPDILKSWMDTKRGRETVEQFNKAYYDVKDKIKLV